MRSYVGRFFDDDGAVLNVELVWPTLRGSSCEFKFFRQRKTCASIVGKRYVHGIGDPHVIVMRHAKDWV